MGQVRTKPHHIFCVHTYHILTPINLFAAQHMAACPKNGMTIDGLLQTQ